MLQIVFLSQDRFSGNCWKPENLRPPWPPGTSGNPAGYSRDRRISDAIERLIEEMALDREFGATAIAMALGKKYMLKRKVKDPETGEEIWVEHKPDIARHLCAIFGPGRPGWLPTQVSGKEVTSPPPPPLSNETTRG